MFRKLPLNFGQGELAKLADVLLSVYKHPFPLPIQMVPLLSIDGLESIQPPVGNFPFSFHSEPIAYNSYPAPTYTVPSEPISAVDSIGEPIWNFHLSFASSLTT